jgi:hypothetical protein
VCLVLYGRRVSTVSERVAQSGWQCGSEETVVEADWIVFCRILLVQGSQLLVSAQYVLRPEQLRGSNVVGGSATSTWNWEAQLGKTDLDGSCCTFVYRRKIKCCSDSSRARSSNRRRPLVACTAMSLGRSSRAKPPLPN